MRKKRRDPIAPEPIVATILAAAVAGVLFLVKPSSLIIIFAFVVLIGIFTYTVMLLLTKNKVDRILVPVAVVLFLASNIVGGFNLINTVLLLSFIIGVKLLFK